jgi:hypothetical protein
MKEFILTLLVLIIFGCQAEKPPQTELILSNIGKTDFIDLWFSIDNSKVVIDSLKPGEQKSFHLDAIGNKRIDYGFKGDKDLRKRMGGELFFYGSRVPMESSILEIGLEDGLIHKIVCKPKN